MADHHTTRRIRWRCNLVQVAPVLGPHSGQVVGSFERHPHPAPDGYVHSTYASATLQAPGPASSGTGTHLAAEVSSAVVKASPVVGEVSVAPPQAVKTRYGTSLRKGTLIGTKPARAKMNPLRHGMSRGHAIRMPRAKKPLP